MILTTPRCQIHSFSKSYIQSALPLFQEPRADIYIPYFFLLL